MWIISLGDQYKSYFLNAYTNHHVTDKIIRILLLKIVNSSMENINKIFEDTNWNLTRSLGDGHCPPIQLMDKKHMFNLIINSCSVS